MSKKETKPKSTFRQRFRNFREEHPMFGFVIGFVMTGISAIVGIKAYHKYVHEPEPWKPHEVSWRDIDDMELLEMHLDDEWFRKDYNVSDEEYAMLKERFSNEETEEVPE